MTQWNTVRISNTVPRRDTDGAIIDAHAGGALDIFDGRYFIFGVSYFDSDGCDDSQHYHAYSSPDLRTWTFHRNDNPSDDLLTGRDPPLGRYYRPYVVHNERTGQYVLWYKEMRHQGVAVADRPEGPYHIHNPQVRISQYHGGGDHDVFIDDDGTAYLIYSGYPHYEIFVEQLTPDYLDSTRIASYIPSPGTVEAPVMFKRRGLYYFLFGCNCDRSATGSDLRVYTAEHPMGPYEYRGNVNRDDNGEIIIKARHREP